MKRTAEPTCETDPVGQEILDPSRSLFSIVHRRRSGGFSAGWARQARCRSEILANARSLLAEEGYSHVAVRQVAARAGVTPPTVYNLVGGRSEVLHRATLEGHLAKVAFAETLAATEQVNVILAYAYTLWLGVSQHPRYSRELIRAVMAPLPDPELPRLILEASNDVGSPGTELEFAL